MKTNRLAFRAALMITMILAITLATTSTRLRADSGNCGGAIVTLPFTDVMGNFFFCQIAEAFFSGLTSGTTPTTYSPSQTVTRDQMAAFITRTMDQSLKRGSRRAALRQFWTPTSENGLGNTDVGTTPLAVISDGADLWVANTSNGTISRVRASDGKLLETWTGADAVSSVLSAKGLIFVAGGLVPGTLYQIDPTQPEGEVTTLTSSLGNTPAALTFDGARIWTANNGGISIVSLNPLSVTNVTTGFTRLIGILYDGANIWVTDTDAGSLFKLDANGAIIQTVTVASQPRFPVFDGTNIWVPSGSDAVTVVRASTGAVLATLTGNGLSGPVSSAFDGERILVTNITTSTVSLWKAADLTPLGFVSTGLKTQPYGSCSDGLNFWIALSGADVLTRF